MPGEPKPPSYEIVRLPEDGAWRQALLNIAASLAAAAAGLALDGTSRIGNPMEGLGGGCGVDRSVSGPGGRILAARSSPALGGGRSAELGPQRGVMRR